MTTLTPPPAWMADGLCAQTDPEAFFPERGGSVKAAQAVCQECPVRVTCLNYAIENGERYGVWGGVAERNRRGMRRAS